MNPKPKEAQNNLSVDGEQLYDPVSGQTVGELENLTPEQLNNLLRKENNRDKEVITAARNCND